MLVSRNQQSGDCSGTNLSPVFVSAAGQSSVASSSTSSSRPTRTLAPDQLFSASSPVGPALTAIRAGCDLKSAEMSAFARPLERIGESLDRGICENGLSDLFDEKGRRIIVAICDARWQQRDVILTAYTEADICPVSSAAIDASTKIVAASHGAGVEAQRRHVVSAAWERWSEEASRWAVGKSSSCSAPDIAVGMLFLLPSVCDQIDKVARTGDTPVLAIALDSRGAPIARVGCSLRALVISLPSWARRSGQVAGRA